MTTTTSRGRHRAPARSLGRWLLPGTGMLALWLADNDPGSAAGLAVFLGIGALLSLFYPLLALLVLEAPGALVPAELRAWYWRGSPGRPHIRLWLRRVVYAADRHRCCLPWCRSSAQIELDHVRPWSLGGRTAFWNMMTLCSYHNLVKSNYWVHRNGRVTYNAWTGHRVPGEAARILAFERRHRWSITRFIRAAMAL